MKISGRAGLIAPFFAMEVLREANARSASGHKVIHLEAGEPGSGAPPKVIAAAARALESGALGYTESLGMPALRARIAEHYQAFYGVCVAQERVVVTVGSSGGFLLAFLAAFDVGDGLALTDPSYPAYRNIAAALGLKAVIAPASAASHFQPTVELLDQLREPVEGLIVASPSNPTGTMLGDGELAALCQWCERRRVRLISDEIYHGISYGRQPETALAFSESAIVLNGFSKYFAMTGWRLGWVVLPEELVRPVERLAQNLFVSPPAIAQHAALAAFDSRAELDANVVRYARNRALLLDALPAAGFGPIAPAEGAFYLYVDVSPLTDDSERFCHQMLIEAGIAATPGIDFDSEAGRRFVRFSFAGKTADIEAACAALKSWLKKR
jgi:aspartate/methionine/tyrosine aminotransferase